jgi:D-psicose/D-tagatose/L-ribulose 3-epimerase
MKLSVSNIAWPTALDAEVGDILVAAGVTSIDVAPGKYFPVPGCATATDIATVRDTWAARGLGIAGMQALLFGTQGLNVFGDTHSQQRMLDHLDSVCRIAAGLGAPYLVFGSPKNRDRTGIEAARAFDLAVDFFTEVGRRAEGHGVAVCLEPNPERYQCNFMTDSASTAAVVRAVDRPSVKMQFDSGAILENGEDPDVVLAAYADIVGHVHISEPGLLPVGEGAASHAPVAAAVNTYLPAKVRCIEMLAPKNGDPIASIQRGVDEVLRVYAPTCATGDKN